MDAYDKAIAWLREQHGRIIGIETSGLTLLDSGDTPGYRAKMREKAEMLASLAHDAEMALSGIEGLSREESQRLVRALTPFADSAETGLALNSVFYMSALLYPDDHKKGDPDNLELCIDRLEREHP